jgi:hypothetical protein
MRVSGFTFIRNAIKYDYPIVESIQSILPLVDEFIVLVGQSDDNTLGLVQAIDSPKIKIIQSVWDDSLRHGGRVLAQETDKAFHQIAAESDWAFYLQGDEVVHEKYLPIIKKALHNSLNDNKLDGFLFKYKHFYGSYDFVGDSRKWYRREIRLIRNNKKIKSYRDAQGFRKENKKLNVKLLDAEVFHYGWVKPPDIQQSKQTFFPSLFEGEKFKENRNFTKGSFDYSKIDSLVQFNESHPQVMQNRIAAKNWNFDFDPKKKNFSFKMKILHFIEHFTNFRIGEYKNYRLLKR